MQILASAHKHGCSIDDIGHALSTARRRWRVGEDPTRWLYLGFDSAARALEIVTIEADDGVECVIHAMKLRKAYVSRGGRS